MSKTKTSKGKTKGKGKIIVTTDGLAKPPKKKVEKKPPQKHTREDALRSITSLRAHTADLFKKGKFTTASLNVVLTCIDNATYYMCCGEFDRSVEICANRFTLINQNA
jgi:hypothetical protein